MILGRLSTILCSVGLNRYQTLIGIILLTEIPNGTETLDSLNVYVRSPKLQSDRSIDTERFEASIRLTKLELPLTRTSTESTVPMTSTLVGELRNSRGRLKPISDFGS